MKSLLRILLPATFAIGAVIAAPFISPKIQHLLPGPDTKVPDNVEIVQDIEETPTDVEEHVDRPEESEQGSKIELSSDIFLQEATVKRIIDGDTLIADTKEQKDMRIRFIGIDTPESVHPDESKNTKEGIYASEFTESLIPEGTVLYLENDISDTDQYGRYLRYIWLTDELPEELTIEFVKENMLNALLIDEGIADVTTFKPDTKYVEIFKALE